MTKSKPSYPANAAGMKKMIDDLRDHIEIISKANEDLVEKNSVAVAENARLDAALSSVSGRVSDIEDEISVYETIQTDMSAELKRRMDKIGMLEDRVNSEIAQRQTLEQKCDELRVDLGLMRERADSFQQALSSVAEGLGRGASA